MLIILLNKFLIFSVIKGEVSIKDDDEVWDEA